jgi:hypothetical protein
MPIPSRPGTDWCARRIRERLGPDETRHRHRRHLLLGAGSGRAARLVALITERSALTDPLAPWLLIHLVSLSATAVTLRFTAFAVQMAIGVYWALRLLVG